MLRGELRGGLLGGVRGGAGRSSNVRGKATNKGKANICINATSDLRGILRQVLMGIVLLPTIIKFCVLCVELVSESDTQRRLTRAARLHLRRFNISMGLRLIPQQWCGWQSNQAPLDTFEFFPGGKHTSLLSLCRFPNITLCNCKIFGWMKVGARFGLKV